MSVDIDRAAEFNLLMLGMVLRVFRMRGRQQLDELRKLLTFVENVPEQFVAEARAVLKEFESEGGVWNFVGVDPGKKQLSGDYILELIRAKV